MKRFDDGSKSLYSINRDSVHELGLYVLARPVAHNVACSGGYRGGQTRPMPPLTNKDTPPVHCNEFNYMSSATHCRSSCRPNLLYVLNITPDTWPFFYCAVERSVRTLRISIAVRKVVDLRSPPSSGSHG